MGLKVIRKSDSQEFDVWKYLKQKDGTESVWCHDWYGHHVIGNDCEFQELDTSEFNKHELVSAAFLSLREGYATTSLFVRRLKMPYSKAFKVMEKLDELKVVDSFDGVNKRSVLMNKEELTKLFN